MATLNVKLGSPLVVDNQTFAAGSTVALQQNLAEALVLAGLAVVADATAQADVVAVDPEAQQALADQISRGVSDVDPQDNPGAIGIT